MQYRAEIGWLQGLHSIDYTYGIHRSHLGSGAKTGCIDPAGYLLAEISGLLEVQGKIKPVICCFPSPTGIWTEEKQQLREKGVVLYPTPERAAKALVGLVKRTDYLSGIRRGNL